MTKLDALEAAVLGHVGTFTCRQIHDHAVTKDVAFRHVVSPPVEGIDLPDIGRLVGFVRRICVLVLLFVVAVRASAATALHDGDLIFQTSRSSQSVAVQRATGSRYSHMGLILHRGDRAYVLEAAATVQYTPLPQWIARGLGQHFVVKRLRDADIKLTPAALRRLRSAGERLLGRPYDLAFGWSDERIYCSELVWKIYDCALEVQIGRLQHLRDFDLSDPAVQAKLRERYGSRVPLDEVVVSPKAMFDSTLLVTVQEQ